MEPLEPRQLLSVAIEMAIQQNVNTPAYVLNGSTVNASLGDAFTVDMYVTLSPGETNDTLAGYALNLVGTDTSISLGQWTRNTTLFPATDNGDTVGFYDDDVSDSRVSGALFGLPPRPTTDMITSGTITGWLLGSLDITLPSGVGSYLLTLSTTDPDSPTDITHQLTPSFVQSTPNISGLTFDLTAGPTATIASVTSPTNSVIDTLDVTFTNIDPGTVALSDFTLTRGGSGGVDLAGFGVTLSDMNDGNDQTYQLTGLSDAGVLGTDGDYVLTLGQANVANLAGVSLSNDAQVTFTIDRTAPVTTVDSLSTDDRTPQLTGTIDDATATLSVMVTHQTTGANQTFSATNNGNGTWTLADNTLSELFGGPYNVKVIATDAVNNTSTTTTSGALVILDVYDKAPADDDTFANAVALTTTFQRDLSIHEVGDADWKSFTLSSQANVLIRAIVPNGEALKVELFAVSDPNTVLETFVASSGQISVTTSKQYAPDNYRIKITENGDDALVTDYDFLAGDASLLAQVEGRYLFYNKSYYDGNDAAANSNDDGAIATDKVALLPGETANFTNYTSYSRGINGVMIDISNLPGVALGDFIFKVGNDNTPDTTWIAAPAPTSISVRSGEGVNGSDRVTLIWADNAIEKQWLQVTVKANANTGLSADDVFYFGNALGDTGSIMTETRVNATDINGAWSNLRGVTNLAPINFAYDVNRDGRVNATDINALWSNLTGVSNSLRLILAPSAQSPSGSSSLLMSPPAQGAAVSEQSGGNTSASSSFVLSPNSSLLAVIAQQSLNQSSRRLAVVQSDSLLSWQSSSSSLQRLGLNFSFGGWNLTGVSGSDGDFVIGYATNRVSSLLSRMSFADLTLAEVG